MAVCAVAENDVVGRWDSSSLRGENIPLVPLRAIASAKEHLLQRLSKSEYLYRDSPSSQRCRIKSNRFRVIVGNSKVQPAILIEIPSDDIGGIVSDSIVDCRRKRHSSRR